MATLWPVPPYICIELLPWFFIANTEYCSFRCKQLPITIFTLRTSLPSVACASKASSGCRF